MNPALFCTTENLAQEFSFCYDGVFCSFYQHNRFPWQGLILYNILHGCWAMGKYRVLREMSPFHFGEGPLRIRQDYLLFCVGCRKMPYTFRQIQCVQETVVISIGRVTPHPPDLESNTPDYLVVHALGYLFFGSECLFFWDMTSLTQLGITPT